MELFFRGQDFYDHISTKRGIFRGGSAASGLDLHFSGIGGNSAFETFSENIHKGLFDFPLVTNLVQKFFKTEFPVNFLFVVKVRESCLLDTTNTDVAYHSDPAGRLFDVAVRCKRLLRGLIDGNFRQSA